MNNTYKAEVFCDNCGYRGTIEIEIGQYVQPHKCPNCLAYGYLTTIKPIILEIK